MILEFKTKRNQYGHRKYLKIDTFNKEFTTHDPHIITEGAEIKTSDYNRLIETCKKSFYIEV